MARTTEIRPTAFTGPTYTSKENPSTSTTREASLFQRVMRQKDRFKTAVWTPINEGLKPVKSALNLTQAVGSQFERYKPVEPAVKSGIKALRLTTNVSFLFTIDSIARGLISGVGLLLSGDFEGVAFTATELGIDLLDAFDSATTIIKQFVTVKPDWLIAPLFSYGLQLGLMMISVSLVMKIVKKMQADRLRGELHQLIKSQMKGELTPEEFTEKVHAFLSDRVGLTKEEIAQAEKSAQRSKPKNDDEAREILQKKLARLKKHKMRKMIRRSSPEIQKALEDLLPIVEGASRGKRLNQNEVNELLRILGDVENSLNVKNRYTNLSISQSIISLIGTALFLAPVPLAVPFAILMVSSGFKYWLYRHQNDYKVPLSDPHFHSQEERLQRELLERLHPAP